jgi:hypothetical protein
MAVSRKWTILPTYYDGCWGQPRCVVDRYHEGINRTMQSLFSEAAADLARTLASLPENRAGVDGPSPAASPGPKPAPETMDETIEGILKGK